MGYLVCEECLSTCMSSDKFNEGEIPDDFHDKCVCGGKIVYIETSGETSYYVSGKGLTKKIPKSKQYLFDCPTNWKEKTFMFSPYSSTVSIFPDSDLGKSEDVIISLHRLNSYSNLDDYPDELIKSVSMVDASNEDSTQVLDPDSKIFKNEKIEVNDIKGYHLILKEAEEFTLGDPHSISEYVLLQDGDNFYELSLTCTETALSTDPNIFEDASKVFEGILHSFKENPEFKD